MKIRRLKISQQLIAVFFIGVILPLCITAIIVTNVNQHAVRAELRYSAVITADNVYQRLEKISEERKPALLYIAKSIDYINTKNKVNNYLNEIKDFSDETVPIDIIKSDENINKKTEKNLFKKNSVEIFLDSSKKSIVMYAKLKNGNYLRKFINIEKLEADIFKYPVNDKRQVYIIDSKNNIVMSYNEEKDLFNKIIPYVPKEYKTGVPVLFGEIKNRPNVFLKLEKPDWAIVVATPRQLTRYGIIDARFKIIAAILVAAVFMMIFGILYSYSLNTNLKQLFKAIAAVGRGNYRRKVRLVKDFFTPSEIVFLMEKFNDMAQKIDEGYKEINEANVKLSKLDKMKSNLIDTVSHEFRTPLTCIKGYTSRLLRSDIHISEEMKIKSLKVIKQQTERFSRLVDDLLVVPEIESELLRIFPSEVDLRDVFETCILSIQQKQHRIIHLDMPEDFSFIWADPDRSVQVIINLLDNAIKYSTKDSEININVVAQEDSAVIKIKNESEPIDEERLQRLFNKFERIEDDLTRTTRGTGLGLFIVRGLIHAMGGQIFLSANDGFEVKFTFPLAG